jgi:hypothetical protein
MEPVVHRAAAIDWDAALWDRVWERMLGPVERHSVAVAVWRRRLPEEPFEAVVAVELARRWRMQAVKLALVYGLWTLFWGALAWSDWRADDSIEIALCPACTVVGLVAVTACFAVRRYLREPNRAGP